MRLGRLLAFAVLLLSAAPVRAQEAVVLGIAPFIGTHQLLDIFGPMARHVESRMKRPVHLATAPDSRTFFGRSLAGEYDFVIVSPHVARLLEQDAGFSPLAGAGGRIASVMVVRRDAPIRTLADLRGKTIALHDPASLSAMLGRERLAWAGLVDGRDVVMRAATNMMTAIYSVTYGDKDGAIIGSGILHMLPAQVGQELRVLAEVGSYDLAGALLAHPRMDAGAAQAFSAHLRHYVEQSEQGGRVKQVLGFEQLRPISTADLKPYDKYATALRREPGYRGHLPAPDR